MNVGQCRCDTELGYILNQFHAEISYGQCVGVVTPCTTNNHCSMGQKCVNGRCACEDGMRELCLKDGKWECVVDPLPDCKEGILPNGKFGCCEQIPNWDIAAFNHTFSHCENQQPINPCESLPCGFYGECFVDGDSFTCKCDDHWGGSSCSEFNHCNPNPCYNGGSCIKAGNHFECICSNDYAGKFNIN